jgi:hypothetical protein
MENRQSSAPASPAPCPTSDLTCGRSGVFLWCLPIVAVVIGSEWSSMRGWLWIPAFLVMGIGCLANAARCGRVHCYVTGPLFLLAAIYVVVAEFHLVPMHPAVLLDTVVVLTLLAYIAEFPLGRYRKT